MYNLSYYKEKDLGFANKKSNLNKPGAIGLEYAVYIPNENNFKD